MGGAVTTHRAKGFRRREGRRRGSFRANGRLLQPTQYDESVKSTVMSAVIAAPTCMRAVGDAVRWGVGAMGCRVKGDAVGDGRSRALQAWAECISAVVTT